MDEQLSDQFDSAANHVASVASGLEGQDLLYLYGRYKQSLEGPCSTSKPGFFDLQGRRKWEAWHALGEMSKEEAMLQYVQKVRLLECGWEPGTEAKPTQGFGLRPSRPVIEETGEEDSAWFSCVKSGDASAVRDLLARGIDATTTDENGMNALHWACDRGLVEVVQVLIDSIPVNSRDQDGQTGLHYAASCAHLDVLRVLLEHGGDPGLTDGSGLSVFDVADDAQTREILSAH